MEVYVGTSGWNYDWNPGGLKWYADESGFNAIELNMSFYSFPKPSTVIKWFEEGAKLRWAVKVHRSITHLRRMNEKSLATWKRFREVFKPLEESIDFYLFQLPPQMPFSEEVERRLRLYAGICEKAAVEPRHASWFNDEVLRFFEELGMVFVTPDSPLFEGLPHGKVYNVRGVCYVRMHGRLTWYNYGYLDEELEEVADALIRASPGRAYVFFNNNHDMLSDGRRMLEILRKKAALK
ncbi:MAG: DUF72 domain-containing protein [Thermofilum sp.]